ncbi:MAG: 50S ribosomal protein L18 [Candidatus Moranbacteria bacterium]|jgi:large subunit ribosomal protein L18|nr:50S ribosomal protein L18 [Candidatus Moranbacteria bacterium]NCA93733.1 50S ribosomal protein L18 [Sphingobacteriia bacterium]NLC30763.1 50S ribosomal protein L18 [Candidatus Moranbacteria bacterium]
MISKNNKRLHRKRRIRAKISGSAVCPRLSVYRSLTNIYLQLIDDEKGNTLASVSTSKLKAKPNMEGAKKVGKEMVKKCQALKIEQIVFDRGGYKYHGRVKALAEEMRKEGLKF